MDSGIVYGIAGIDGFVYILLWHRDFFIYGISLLVVLVLDLVKADTQRSNEREIDTRRDRHIVLLVSARGCIDLQSVCPPRRRQR